jgi:UDP-glucose:(heptosyl)LPS alpha-1,3-glucosyltransferase
VKIVSSLGFIIYSVYPCKNCFYIFKVYFMKLAFCLFRYYPHGGLERDFMKIALECYKRGHSIDVYTISWDAHLPKEFNVIQIPVTGMSNHARCNSFISSVLPRLKAGEYDLIMGFNQMPGLDVYFAADVCFRASARRKHNSWYQLTPRYRSYAKNEQAVFAADNNTKILLLVEPEKKKKIVFIYCRRV